MKSIITNFISDYFPDSPNILHFGSSLTNETFNDIDLLIISNKNSFFTKEVINYKNQIFELIILPKIKASQILEVNKKSGIYNQIIKEGKILVDNDGFLCSLKQKINQETSSYFLLRKYGYEQNIKNLLITLKNNQNKFEKDILVNDIIKLIIDLKLLEFDNLSFFEQTKHKIIEINKYSPLFIEKLVIIKNKYLENNSFENFIFSINNFIPIKSIIEKTTYSNQLILNKAPNDLVIFFKNFKPNTLKKFMFWLQNMNLKFFNFNIYNSFFDLEKGTYIIIRLENSTIKKNRFILQLDNFFSFTYKTDSDLFIKYPYLLDIYSFLGVSQKESSSIEYFFSQTSNKIFFEPELKETKLIFNYIFLILKCYLFKLKKDDLKNDLSLYGNFLGQSFKNDTIKKDLFNKLYHYDYSNFQNFKDVIYSFFYESIKKWDYNYLPKSKLNNVEIGEFMELESRINIIIFASNFFSISNEYLVFIFHTLGEMLEKSYEN
ncbi:hypothetical protein ACQY1Q_11205 [Tenacibaculum sp. TC6]